MKRVLWMALLMVALPVAAFATSSVDFTNSGGTLSGTSAGMSLTGSELIAVNGLNGMGLVQGNLGTVSFSTGALTGTSTTGGVTTYTFAAGGTFNITGSGSNGIPSGTIFTGTFNNPVTVTVTVSNGTYIYSVQGGISGTWANGTTASGVTVGVTFSSTNKNLFGGPIKFGSGDTTLASVPEPGTLALLGTGLLGLAGVLRRKAKG